MAFAQENITPAFGARLRQPTLANLREDLKLVRSGIMDVASFLSGYRRWQNPVQVEVRGPDGKLKAIRRTHNIRTNTGAIQQGNRMAGTVAGFAPATNLGALTTNAQPLVLGLAYEASDIAVNSSDGYLGANSSATASATQINREILGNGLVRGLVDTVTWSFTPTAAGSTQLTAIYYLKKIWTASGAQTVTKVGVFDNATAPASTTQQSGNLWFEFDLTASPVTMASGDTITVTYTITI